MSNGKTASSARTVLKVAGESGMGLLSVGRILAKTLKEMGFYIHSDREYPSRMSAVQAKTILSKMKTARADIQNHIYPPLVLYQMIS